MSENRVTPPIEPTLRAALKRAVTEKRLFPALAATTVAICLVLIPIVGLVSNIVTIVNSSYIVFAVSVMVVVAILVMFSVYLVRLWDEILSQSTLLLRQIAELKGELTLTQAHLTTAQARNNDLTGYLITVYDDFRRDLLHQFESYLEKQLLEIERTQQLRKVNLPSGGLTTTFVQQDGSGFTVTLPIGKRHGDIQSLAFVLERLTDDPNRKPAYLGKAVITSVEEERSFAVVDPVPLQQGFWDRVVSECNEQGGGYKLELAVKPAMDQQLSDCSPESLSTLQSFLKRMIQEIKTTGESAQSSYKVEGEDS